MSGGRWGWEYCLVKPIEDPLFPAKLKLIEFLSYKLNKFLRCFQTDQPMVPFLSDTLEEIDQ